MSLAAALEQSSSVVQVGIVIPAATFAAITSFPTWGGSCTGVGAMSTLGITSADSVISIWGRTIWLIRIICVSISVLCSTITVTILVKTVISVVAHTGQTVTCCMNVTDSTNVDTALLLLDDCRFSVKARMEFTLVMKAVQVTKIIVSLWSGCLAASSES